tara:strand:+ start:18716 stop:18904 length:189 start_codon:yes stop_codon:yes gene_type:complete
MRVKLTTGEEMHVSYNKTALLKRGTVASVAFSVYDIDKLLECDPTAMKEKLNVLSTKYKRLV